MRKKTALTVLFRIHAEAFVEARRRVEDMGFRDRNRVTCAAFAVFLELVGIDEYVETISRNGEITGIFWAVTGFGIDAADKVTITHPRGGLCIKPTDDGTRFDISKFPIPRL